MRTQHFPAALDADHCLAAYTYLQENLSWEEGIRSRKGFTRLAKALDLRDDPVVEELITEALKKAGGEWEVLGVYANYYQDGSHWTPSHSHKGTCQLVVSLNATRTLIVNKKPYALKNGDVIIFGAGAHEVPKEPEVQEGRISLATFMVPKAQAAAARAAQLSALLGGLNLQ